MFSIKYHLTDVSLAKGDIFLSSRRHRDVIFCSIGRKVQRTTTQWLLLLEQVVNVVLQSIDICITWVLPICSHGVTMRCINEDVSWLTLTGFSCFEIEGNTVVLSILVDAGQEYLPSQLSYCFLKMTTPSSLHLESRSEKAPHGQQRKSTTSVGP
jgi:hypothetical protein